MPLQASRVLKTFKYAWYFDGVNDYVKVEPFSVYGWSEYTVVVWTYPWAIPLSGVRRTAMVGYNAPTPVVWYGTWIEVLGPSFGSVFRHFFQIWRPSDNAMYSVMYDMKLLLPGFVNSVFIVSKNLGRYRLYVNASLVRDINISSYLSQGYVTPMDRNDMIRFVLGANPYPAEYAPVFHYSVLIYNRSLSDSEISYNYLYPDNPIRNGLVLWLRADPNNVRDIDNDGVLEWIDLSGYNNHGKIYGASLVQLVKPASRILPKARILNILR